MNTCKNCDREITIDSSGLLYHSDTGIPPCVGAMVDPDALTDTEGTKYPVAELSEYILVPVEKLIEGLLVSLEGDKFADPNNDDPAYPYELVRVYRVEEETPECTAVEFDNAWVGFPHGHEVKVLREGATP